ncbi:MAG: hypothetical protein Q8N26_28450 [Myxococcales bacterium]|nr:hypothetical protein [Myxococcales bacterium]
MSSRPRASRSVGAIVLSLGVHALAGLAMYLTPSPPPRAPAAAALTWVDVAPAVEDVTPPAPAVTPEPVRPATETATRKKKKTSPAVQTSAGDQQPTSPSTPSTTTGGTDSPLAERGSGPAVAAPGKRPSLTPGAGFVMNMPEARDAEDTRGTTLRNEVMDQPDQQAVAEYEAERAGRKLSLDLATDVARAQQGAGRVPGFFTSAAKSLQDAAEKADVKVSKDSMRQQSLNALGSVLDPTRTRPSDDAIRRVAETASVQNARIGNPALPGDQQAFNQAVAQGFSRFESIRENLSATQLRTVVSLTTDARGVLAEASITERSGDLTFDESALHLSRKVMRTLPDSDDKALGTSWWRSRWVFTWEPPRMKVRFLDATPMPPPM